MCNFSLSFVLIYDLTLILLRTGLHHKLALGTFTSTKLGFWITYLLHNTNFTMLYEIGDIP